tara:strand:+ start:418 stop:768 length:351 start_codon:yes stop_codon:yes gene_type:complete
MIKGPIEIEMADAWGRRIARDWPDMPVSMQALFRFAWGFHGASQWLAWFSVLAGLGTLLWIASGTWLVGGSGLISAHPFLPAPFVLLLGAVCFRWLLPGVVNLMVTSWYYKARSHF